MSTSSQERLRGAIEMLGICTRPRIKQEYTEQSIQQARYGAWLIILDEKHISEGAYLHYRRQVERLYGPDVQVAVTKSQEPAPTRPSNGGHMADAWGNGVRS